MNKYLYYLLTIATFLSCFTCSPTPVKALVSNLTATLSTNNISVDLAWQSDTPPDYYKIERAIDGTTEWEERFSLIATDITTTHYTDTTTWRGRSYNYRIAECRSFSCSQYSNIANISIPSLNNTNPKLIKNIPSLINPYDVEVVGNYAFVLDPDLKVVDISNPAKPLLVSSLVVQGSNLNISGDYAYVVADRKIIVISIKDVLHPFIVSEFSVLSLYRSNGRMTLDGNYLYVGDSYDGLIIVDISVPTNLMAVSTINLPGWIKNIKINGDYAYIGCDVTQQYSTLYVVNIADPLSPQLSPNNIVMPKLIKDIAFIGNYAYITNDLAGTQIVNITNPFAPSLEKTVPSLTTSSLALGIKIDTNYAYITTGFNTKGLQVLNVANPQNPTQVGNGSIDANNLNVGALDIENNRLIMIGGSAYAGLTIADISNPADITKIGQIGNKDIYPIDQLNTFPYYYTLNYYSTNLSMSGLNVYNISNPNEPYQIGRLDIPNPKAFVKVDNYLYVVGNEFYLYIVDISDPSNPRQISNTTNTYTVGYDIAVSGDYAYIVGYSSGITVMDIKNKTAPVYKTRLAMQPGSTAVKLAISGTKAYIAATKTIQIVDIQSPLNPHLDGFLTVDPTNTSNDIVDVAVSGNFAYFACGGQGVKVVNIQNSHAPVIQATTPALPGNIEAVSNITITGNYLFSNHAGNPRILQVYDIANPLAPVSVSTQGIGYVSTVSVIDRYIYVGLSIFDLYYDRPKVEKRASVTSQTRGGEITYTLTITNSTPYNLTGLNLSDSVPVGTTFIEASNGVQPINGNITWDLGDIPPKQGEVDGKIEVSFKVRVN